MEMEVSDLSAGTYFIHLVTPHTTTEIKIIQCSIID